MGHSVFWVDDAAHLLHLGGHTFPCDRDIIAALPWKNHALLLSSDTDCLSLWDTDGLIRTARVGVYPQDMTLQDDTAFVCGGADSTLHLLRLPSLHTVADFLLPGMPERIFIHAGDAWILSLLSENELCTLLLRLNLKTGACVEITRFAGIPGALAADADGLWVGVSELVIHLPWDRNGPDMIIEGVSLAKTIEVLEDGLVIADNLEDRLLYVRRPRRIQH